MIEVKDISFAYGKHRILENVSFTAQAGECVGILGNNGAGKSTLITCINRIRTPERGEVIIEGKSVREMGRNEMARTIAYVAQKNEMSHATVFDCVLLGRKPYIKWGVSQEDLDLCEAMIRRVGMEDFQVRNLDELSGGELQKVMLARALVQQPRLLLLDEPTSNLDPLAETEIFKKYNSLAKDKTVIYVTHRISVARLADRIIVFKNGKIEEDGSFDELMQLQGEFARLYELQSQWYDR